MKILNSIKINGVNYDVSGDVSSIIGTATSEYDTLGKVQNKIESEIQRATQIENTKANKATTLAGYGITDAYNLTDSQEFENEVERRLNLQDAAIQLYNGNEVVVITDHTDTAEVSNPDTQKIYREYGTTSYSDWMCVDNESDPKQWRKLATYEYPGIDNEPTADSNKLVKSGDIYNIQEASGKVVYVEEDVEFDGHNVINTSVSFDKNTAVDVSNANKVSFKTFISFANPNYIIGFYDSEGNPIISLNKDSDGVVYDSAWITVTEYLVPKNAAYLNITFWNQPQYDLKKDECYIKVWNRYIVGGIIGNNADLNTQEKHTIVGAINELKNDIINTGGYALTDADKVNYYNYCSCDGNSFTVGTPNIAQFADKCIAVWNIGVSKYFRILHPESVYCVVATETMPVKGPTGTTSMLQFNPEIIWAPIEGKIIRDYGVMPKDKPFITICCKNTIDLGDYIYVEGKDEATAYAVKSNTNVFSGKTVSFIGDSFFNDGPAVCNYFAKMTNMSHVNNARDLLSKGGQLTLGGESAELCAQWRARKLEDSSLTVVPDVLVIENVNDGPGEDLTYQEVEDMVPFMLSRINDVNTGKTTKESAIQYFEDNFNSITGSINPQLGSMIRLAYAGQAFVITVTTGTTTAGVVNITAGNNVRQVNVGANASAADVAEAIASYKYEGFSVKYTGGNSLTLTNIGNESSNITFNGGNTGAAATVTENTSDGHVGYCYWSADTSQWNNRERWFDPDLGEIPLCAIYKGLIQYLCTTFPDMWIFWMLPTRYDNENTPNRNRHLREWLRHWNIPMLDCEQEGSINRWNWRNFCPAPSIHQNQYAKGVLRWAEAMVRCLI